MKKLIALILVIAMCACSFAALAEGKLSVTQEILSAFEEQGWKYAVADMADGDTEEHVTTAFAGQYIETIQVDLYVSADTGYVSLFTAMSSFDSANTDNVLRIVNILNQYWSFVKFFADTTNCIVYAELDLYTISGTAGTVVEAMTESLVSIVDSSYAVILTASAAGE